MPADEYRALMNALQSIAELDGWGISGAARQMARDALRAQYCREVKRSSTTG